MIFLVSITDTKGFKWTMITYWEENSHIVGTTLFIKSDPNYGPIIYSQLERGPIAPFVEVFLIMQTAAEASGAVVDLSTHRATLWCVVNKVLLKLWKAHRIFL